MNTTLTPSRNETVSKSRAGFRTADAMNHRAWVAKAAKQPLVFESVDLEPLGAEDVEVEVEHCGLCHSDLSILNNEWGLSQYPAILGHEVVGRITAIGPNAKGLKVGQRVGVGWSSGAACTVINACQEAITFVRKCNSPLSAIVAASPATFARIGGGPSRCRTS